MPHALAVTPRARADLSEIYDYTVYAWGLDQADAYNRLIEAAFEDIAKRPLLGRRVRGRGDDIRKRLCRSHVIYYRLSGDGVEIVRVLHQMMDPDRHLRRI